MNGINRFYYTAAEAAPMSQTTAAGARTEELPWNDCKVAFDVDHEDAFEAWAKHTNYGEGILPNGWELNETDVSGARMVAVFRVKGALTIEDGKTVLNLLAALAKTGGAA